VLNENILWIVPLLSLIGSGRYVWQVLKGKAKPNRVTWILWALAPLIAFVAEIHQGVGLQSVLTFMVGFGPLLVVMTSFIGAQAEWKLTRFDIACGILSLLGLCLWLITRHGDIAIAFSIFADALAGLPTLVKSYKAPETESYLVFLLASINSVLTLLTIKVWTFANYGFPAYTLLICLLLTILIKFKVGPWLRSLRVPA
jgi:hypothetical protein